MIPREYLVPSVRFLIGLYQGPRLLTVDGVVVSAVRVWSAGVVAGCAHATALMELALAASLDYTRKCWPSVRLSVVVDPPAQ